MQNRVADSAVPPECTGNKTAEAMQTESESNQETSTVDNANNNTIK